MTNENLCLRIQANDKEKDAYLVELLQQNAVAFRQWVMEALAEAITDTVKIAPDEMMAEALGGFRRAAEVYRPETHVDYIDYAEAWVKAKVRSYVRRAERGDLPDYMLSSVKEYRRILDLIQYGVENGSRTSLCAEQIRTFLDTSLLLLGQDRRLAAVGI